MSLGNYFSAANLTCIRDQHQLFSDVSFVLKAGEVLFVEGQNGAGKSSLLRLLAGLATPETGKVEWQGQPILDNPHLFLNALHYIGHANGIKLGLTVNENIELMGRLSTEQVVSAIRTDEILSKLKLLNYKHTSARNLSAGQRRRISLAKLLLFPKILWILDEPFTSLDVDTQTIFLQALDAHLQNGGMVIASSHQPIELSRVATTLRLSSC